MVHRHQLTPEEICQMQELLLNWFETHQRVFPWRETRNPFHILIAEKLLQQTSVGERVITAYTSITNEFSNSKSLSNARVEDLQGLVAPLGLHYRAKELIHLAEAIESKYLGILPKDYELLMDLPGIGEYTARAILSFAYEEGVAIVDTNVARFLFRLLGIDGPLPANPARKRSLIDLATSLLPAGKIRDFNFAILDLCAAICKPQKPDCANCPISRICYTGHHDTMAHS